MMPLTEKDIQEQVKKGPEEIKAFENKFESPEAAKKAKFDASEELKNKLIKGKEGADWDKIFDTLKVETFLKTAPSLKKDLYITVRLTDAYKKEDRNKNEVKDIKDIGDIKDIKDIDKVTTIRNEFYTTENLSSDLDNLGMNEGLIQIQIPDGERVGYFTGKTVEDTRVVLRKNAEYQIDGKTNTVIKGKMRVVWKAKLIKSKAEDTSENKPTDTQKETNETFNAEEYGKKWIEGLSNKELEAMKDYTSDEYYRSINGYLRNGELPKDATDSKGVKITASNVRQKIKYMDNAIDLAPPLAQDIKVYRRSTEPEFKKNGDFLKHMFNLDLDSVGSFETYTKNAIELVNKNMNKINIDKAYRSTSLNNEVPKDPFFTERPISVEITIPKGTRAPYLASISPFPQEKEILLKHGSKFKITGASTVQETGQVMNHTRQLETKQLNTLVIRATLVQ